MRIIEVDTDSRRQVEAFLDLPFRLYRDVPQWVPPLRHEARLALNRKRHPYFRDEPHPFARMRGTATTRQLCLQCVYDA